MRFIDVNQIKNRSPNGERFILQSQQKCQSELAILISQTYTHCLLQPYPQFVCVKLLH